VPLILHGLLVVPLSLVSVSASIGTEPSECQDWRVELQSYVDRGTLTCADAEKYYREAGCSGSVGCKASLVY